MTIQMKVIEQYFHYAVRDVRNGALVVGWSFQWHLLHVNSGNISFHYRVFLSKNFTRKKSQLENVLCNLIS